MWNKCLKIAVITLMVVLLAVCVGVFLLISYTKAENTMDLEQSQERVTSTGDYLLDSHPGNEAPEGTVTLQPPVVPEDFLGEEEDSLSEEDGFLSEELSIQWEQVGENQYQLSWNETKNDGYLVEFSKDGNTWERLAEVTSDAERVFTTGHLLPFESYSLRVSTLDGTIGDTMSVTTSQRLSYCTVWPVQELAVYKAPDGIEKIGTVPAGSAHCLLAETDGMFAVRFGETIGYVDNRYCMINVAEYLGNLCNYNIPNSYASVYRIHGVDIPKVTDTVIYGYQDVLQANGLYLVPVLYPAAQKLLQAALSARDLGYRLKIYDSYRPYGATKEIYALTQKILGEYAPDGEQTLQELMTDKDRFGLGNFLAPVTSRHNYGVALDLTLETLDGKEMQMQTVIHDLSWYSALENNNANADMLQKLMVAEGFATLKSEWWHFQDAESFDSLKPAYLTEGVSAECWVMDDSGWRYRLSDGAFVVDQVKNIDGKDYEFDADGYVH